MISIYQNRRHLGIFLLLSVAVVTMIGYASLREVPLAWPHALLLLLLAPVGFLLWQFIVNRPVITIGDGYFTVHRDPVKPIRIPLSAIREVRYRQPTSTAGEGRLLEIHLHQHTPQTESLRDAYWHRALLKDLTTDPSGYSPPVEPFLLLQLPPLAITEAELRSKVEA